MGNMTAGRCTHAGLVCLGVSALADHPVLGLELHGLLRVVDEGEASGSSATEVGAHVEDLDLLGRGLVHLTELLGELVLRDVGPRRVDDVENALSPLEQRVAKELARAQGDRRVGVLQEQCSVSLCISRCCCASHLLPPCFCPSIRLPATKPLRQLLPFPSAARLSCHVWVERRWGRQAKCAFACSSAGSRVADGLAAMRQILLAGSSGKRPYADTPPWLASIPPAVRPPGCLHRRLRARPPARLTPARPTPPPFPTSFARFYCRIHAWLPCRHQLTMLGNLYGVTQTAH